MDYLEYHKRFLAKFKLTLISNRRARLIRTNENPNKCPSCGAETKLDMDRGEIYCTCCGLIVKCSIKHSGVHKLNPPYGILL